MKSKVSLISFAIAAAQFNCVANCSWAATSESASEAQSESASGSKASSGNNSQNSRSSSNESTSEHGSESGGEAGSENGQPFMKTTGAKRATSATTPSENPKSNYIKAPTAPSNYKVNSSLPVKRSAQKKVR